ncbi:hypothetical protein QBC43DRAFT_373766 [Cladorrhinum sp. PSN259]|nr:hypothetical protein QBC43DRAFT_373766 [Cladorrhinum sp. PSN259]
MCSMQHAVQDCLSCRLTAWLTRYNEALVTQSFLAKLDEPNKQDLEFLRSWFERPRMGGFPIRGLDRRAWDPEHEKDLVSFKPRLNPDLDPESSGLGQGIFVYRESRLAAVIETVVTVVASVLPLLSTIVLWLLKNETVKLGAIVALSAIFPFALATMTSARRVEIFAATAAFAAVNVVFLTGPPTATGETSCEASCQNAGTS